MKTNLFNSIPKFEIAETYANMLFDDFCKHLDIIGGVEEISVEESVFNFLKSKSVKLNDTEITTVFETSKKYQLDNYEFDFSDYFLGAGHFYYMEITINKSDFNIYIPHTHQRLKSGGSLTSFKSYKTLAFEKEHNINEKCRFHIMDAYIRACLISTDSIEFSKEFSKILVDDYFYNAAQYYVPLAIQDNRLSFFLTSFIDVALNANYEEIEDFSLGKTKTNHDSESPLTEILIEFKSYQNLFAGEVIIDNQFEFIARFPTFFFKFRIFECDEIDKADGYNPCFEKLRRTEILRIEKSAESELSIADEKGFATDEYFELFKMCLFNENSKIVTPSFESIDNVYDCVTMSKASEMVFLIDYIAEKEGITTADVQEYIKEHTTQENNEIHKN